MLARSDNTTSPPAGRLYAPNGRDLLPTAAATRRGRAVRALRARYDAAQTSVENRRHWANADALSPSAASRADVRAVLRRRSRYECHESNSIANGIINSLAIDTIGTGPRLQVTTPDPAFNNALERTFNGWARQVNLAAKLRTMRVAKAVDGESFALAANNDGLRHAVKLDVRLIEADQVTSPGLVPSPNYIDGIRFDDDGNPIEYDVLREHPGTDAAFGVADALRADPMPASAVVHYFRENRPGQRRGIPEIAPALPLFALLRRYTLAVIAAAETAADFAGVVYSDSPATDPDDVEPLESIELEMRSLLTLPAGWKMGQIKAEQPSTRYVEFRNAVIEEIARCVAMPANKALGNSSSYNFASGRLDHQGYYDAISCERQHIETNVLDRMLFWWFDEAALLPGVLPDGGPTLAELPYRWRWPRRHAIDPLKQALADETLWEMGLLTDETWCFENDVDVDDLYQQATRQRDRRRAADLPMPGERDRTPLGDNARAAAATAAAGVQDDQGDATE